MLISLAGESTVVLLARLDILHPAVSDLHLVLRLFNLFVICAVAFIFALRQERMLNAFYKLAYNDRLTGSGTGKNTETRYRL